MERFVTEIARFNFIIEPCRERIVRKCPAHVRSFLQLKTSLDSAGQSQVAQIFLSRDPSAEADSTSAKLFARFVEMKHEISVRLHSGKREENLGGARADRNGRAVRMRRIVVNHLDALVATGSKNIAERLNRQPGSRG